MCINRSEAVLSLSEVAKRVVELETADGQRPEDMLARITALERNGAEPGQDRVGGTCFDGRTERTQNLNGVNLESRGILEGV